MIKAALATVMALVTAVTHAHVAILVTFAPLSTLEVTATDASYAIWAVQVTLKCSEFCDLGDQRVHGDSGDSGI